LLKEGHDIVVWNRTIAKAEEAVGDLTNDIRAFDLATITETLSAGDVIVSMLPGDWHVPLAEAAIAAKANFVSSSYIAPEMRALDEKARAAGVASVNEVGLDPGIDHLMAHALVADYRADAAFDPENELSFLSYCGGVPKHANPFCYKFSWSPAGVLKALRSPSKSIRNGEVFDVARPWDAISSYVAPLAEAESFEVYPNRDSLPFMPEYGFEDSWNVKEFVRGTLRLNGWSKAWSDIFTEIETLKGPEGDARINELSSQLWDENAYDEGEPDRVILCVDLKAEKAGETVYHKTYVLDAWGDERGSAMARLVSMPVAMAIKSVLKGEIESGVSAAPKAPELYNDWLTQIDALSQHFALVKR